jgi:hypothetical protein
LEGCDGAIVQCTVVPSDGIDDGPASIRTIRLEGQSLGDTNCDGSIDIEDMLAVLNDWGTCSMCAGDLNGNGEVNIIDLLRIIGNWS